MVQWLGQEDARVYVGEPKHRRSETFLVVKEDYYTEMKDVVEPSYTS